MNYGLGLRGKYMTITQKIIEIHLGKTARHIADLVGTSPAYVYNVSRLHGLTLTRDNRRHNTKITQAQADVIREDFRPLAVIASDYSISAAQACRIRSGQHFNVRDIKYIAEKSLHNPKELRGAK